MTGDARLALPSGAHAPARARAWLAERVGGVPEEVVEDALLVVSELVTNAIRHGRAEVVLTLEHIARGMRISVSDAGEEMPVALHAVPELDRPNGRGLMIVAATAATWGVRRNDPAAGKTVWADLVLG